MNMLTNSLLRRSAAALALVLCAGSAGAADVTATDNAAIRQTVRDINPNAVIRSIQQSPVAGLKRVVADATVIYTTDDGRYLFYGVVLDTKTRRNLTDEALAEVRLDLLKSIPASAKVIFKPKNPKYTVTVFTDTSCHYCQLMHKSLQGYLDAGIQVEYVPFPRGGVQSPELATMQSIWCSKDRNKAYSQAITGAAVPQVTCANGTDVAKMYELGDKLGIEGTPAIYDATGRQLGGFLPPAAMLGKLQAADKALERSASTAKSP